MSKEFAEKMFNAFEQERSSTVSGVEGTGLGLSITKSIIDLMGGTIEVLTAPGSGTQIVIRLKFKLADEKDVPSDEKDPADVPEEEEKEAPVFELSACVVSLCFSFCTAVLFWCIIATKSY